MSRETTPDECWENAKLAAALIAIDPGTLKGTMVRASHGPARDAWRQIAIDLWLTSFVPSCNETNKQHDRELRLPRQIELERLVGGVDISATLATGTLVEDRGLLKRAGGQLVSMCLDEGTDPAVVHAFLTTLDNLAENGPQDAFGLIVFDESTNDTPTVPANLADRLAFHIDLSNVSHRVVASSPLDLDLLSSEHILSARRLLADVTMSETFIAATCEATLKLGVRSQRADQLTCACARALAALHGRTQVDEDDLRDAFHLSLLPRAGIPLELTQDTQETTTADDEQPDPIDQDQNSLENQTDANTDEDVEPLPNTETAAAEDIGVDTIAGQLLAQDLLDQLAASPLVNSSARSAGRRPGKRLGRTRGKPLGIRRATGGKNEKLNLIATLHAAAPWQRIRKQAASGAHIDGTDRGQLAVRREDFRVTRFRQSPGQTIVFAVDASGSTALGRLGEAKGAIELLLGESYRRRDEVALISFRRETAETLLAPTRSLVRAKRTLASLTGGGGTPLAAGLSEAGELAAKVERSGRSPIIVLISDGRPNIALDGSADRQAARADALQIGQQLGRAGWSSLVFDVSPRRHDFAKELADAMHGGYHHLPAVRSQAIANTVRTTLTDATRQT